jgi:hypothetical protein
MDQIFILVRQYCYDFAYLRRGNTPKTRQALVSGVETLLNQHSDWIQPKTLPDGTTGYGVTAVPSSDQRQIIVNYRGVIVRGVQTILVNGSLEIAV